MERIEKKMDNMQVAQATYARNLVSDVKKALLEEVDQKMITVRTELTQQINDVRQYLHGGPYKP